MSDTTVGYAAVDRKVKSEAGNRAFALDSFTAAAWRAYLTRLIGRTCGSWPSAAPPQAV
ncbi:hypothetical protein ACN27F_19990 [Solwaraspora sp. WMMB335]|uniref:hypothetical protein n=1 Tax=Solwaraspora sp. WMMB335 TaxID=3404118 RepID=UPI003B937B37